MNTLADRGRTEEKDSTIMAHWLLTQQFLFQWFNVIVPQSQWPVWILESSVQCVAVKALWQSNGSRVNLSALYFMSAVNYSCCTCHILTYYVISFSSDLNKLSKMRAFPSIYCLPIKKCSLIEICIHMPKVLKLGLGIWKKGEKKKILYKVYLSKKIQKKVFPNSQDKIFKTMAT